jgi:uncharacterized protein (TIGR02145 family)
MKRNLILMMLFLALGAVSMNGQVRIGGTTAPNAGAILDLNATDAANNATKGLALPRVQLKSVTNSFPLAVHTAGVAVYNTTTVSGDINTAVQPGEYYNNGARWIKVRNAADQINYTDLSETFKTSLTMLIQDLIKTNGVVTNNCVDSVKGVNTAPTWYKVGDFDVAGCWMTENLRDSTNTGAIRQDSIDDTNYSIAVYTYPRAGAKDSMNSSNVPTLGLIYTWAAATKRTNVSTDEGYPATNAQVQGICPSGWHIPSDQEWSQLEMVIANDTAGFYSTHGNVTPWYDWYFTADNQDRGTHGWKMLSSVWGPGTSNAFNSTTPTHRGINLQAAGLVNAKGSVNFGTHSYNWSASNKSATQALTRQAYITSGQVRRVSNGKNNRWSVRCKRD